MNTTHRSVSILVALYVLLVIPASVLIVLVPGVFEDLDEFDAPAGVDDGTEVVATEYWGQNHIHHIESVQLLMQENSLSTY